MANELRITTGVAYANASLKDTVATATLNVNQTLQELYAPVVAVPTSDTVLAVSGITNLGYIYIQNLDPTNFITYGPTSGGAIVPFGKLKPGEWAILRLKPGITFRWLSDTAICKALVKFYGD